MPKNVLDDMVKVKTTRKETREEKVLDSEVEDKFNSYYNNLSKREQKKVTKTAKPKNGNSLWFVALISALFLFFALSFLFASATVTVVPTEKTAALNQSFVAIKDGTTAPDGVDTIPFSLTEISGEETDVLPAGQMQNVSQAATGTVIIYNAYSAAPQRLDINTRLEGSNGKIYKTTTAVVVPGKTGSTPGSVQVDIYGSAPGDEYNSPALDFKIFGFKGTPKYTKIYARSQGDITGGLVGQSSTVSDDDKATATTSATVALQQKLFDKISNQIPTGFILFKDAVAMNVDSTTFDTTTSASQATVTVKGTLYGFIFDESKITQKIAAGAIANYDSSPVHISNIDSLTFALLDKADIDFQNVQSIAFTLSGSPTIVWDVDTDKLAQTIAGKKKSDFNQILSQYQGVSSAAVSIRPIWKFSFPDNPDKIKVILTPAQ